MNASLPEALAAAPTCRNEGCFGSILPVAKDGRFYRHRDIMINIPKDFVILRCSGCSQDYFTQETKAVFTTMLEDEYQKHAPLVAEVIAKFRRKAAGARAASK